MNMRIAKLSMDSSDKTKFEILGKSSVKYHLRANHSVEAKRWFWALNNAIQWAKDEAREEDRKASKESAARQAIAERAKDAAMDTEPEMPTSYKSALSTKGAGVSIDNTSKPSIRLPPGVAASTVGDDNVSAYDSYEVSIIDDPQKKQAVLPGEADLDDEELDEESVQMKHIPKDAFNITAHSASMQLEMLAQVSQAMRDQTATNPATPISEPIVGQALETYASAVQSLKSMVGDLLRIARDRDSYWQYRLDRESDLRRLWEESMAQVAKDQEALEGRIGESEEKRKRTKKALRDALDESTGTLPQRSVVFQDAAESRITPEAVSSQELDLSQDEPAPSQKFKRRRSTIAAFTELSDSDSDADEEFFDAVGAGEVPVESMPVSPPPTSTSAVQTPASSLQKDRVAEIQTSFIGYEDEVRKRLAMDNDDRPTISLWVSPGSFICSA